ncbi:MAG: DNA polymerase III subunit epsilon [Proteobacteria bacterium]|nr:DNA polymerase III subunit epsilon [Pseudomonadota bacterium]MDA0983440.1 DNA polymerase III subunit epsilon [Pseudomonadota bacterium]
MAARQIVLDTETTGLDAKNGDRVVEIGCIELLNRRVGERGFHRYLNPERDIEEGAAKVHGLTLEFLSDKPRFAEVAAEFLDYIAGAELIIHNADFDVGFLDAELKRARLGRLKSHVSGVVDTLAMARELHPGKRNSLDALCERYAIDNAHRTLHGAQLDARLLADVYLAMTRGQESLVIELDTPAEAAAAVARVDNSKLKIVKASKEEEAAHQAYLDTLDKAAAKAGGSLWRKLQGT